MGRTGFSCISLLLSFQSSASEMLYPVTPLDMSDLEHLLTPSRTVKLWQLDFPALYTLSPLVLYPVTTSSQVWSPPAPSPDPLLSDDGESGPLVMMTSLLGIIDQDAQPMSLSLSMTQPLESLASDSSQVIQAQVLQARYPNVFAMIAYIEKDKPHHEGRYDTSKQWYEVSHEVLEALNEVLTPLMNGGIPAPGAEQTFRRLFATLHINLFWRITDKALLKNLLTLTFQHPGQIYCLLSILENFLSFLRGNTPTSSGKQNAIQIHLLQLLAQNYNNPAVQQLISQKLYLMAFLAMVLPDPHVQRHLSFGGYAHQQNFGARRTTYPNFFSQMGAYITGAGMSSDNARFFLDFLMQLLRRGAALYKTMQGFQCRPAAVNHFLSFLEQHLGSYPSTVHTTIILLNNPLLVQAAAVFTNHLYNGSNQDAVTRFISVLHTCPLPQQNTSEALPVALWMLEVLAIASPKEPFQSQSLLNNTVVVLTKLGLSGYHIKSTANHLLTMMTFYAEGEITEAMEPDQMLPIIKRFLENLLKGQLKVNPIAYLPPVRK